MTGVADLIGSIATLSWAVLAFFVVFVLRKVLSGPRGPLTKMGLGPSGVTFEFAESKIDEAASLSGAGAREIISSSAAKRSVITRMQRNAEVLSRARILWVDDHPENNHPIVQLLDRFGASVDTPRTNSDATRLLEANHYDVVISDVARDNEGDGSGLKGVELAREVFDRWGMKILLFTGRFNPATLPGASAEERLQLVEEVRRTVFASTTRMDEALHYILDLLER